MIYKVYDDLVDAGDVDRYLREAKEVHYDINCTDDNSHLSGASSAMSNHSYTFNKLTATIDKNIEEVRPSQNKLKNEWIIYAQILQNDFVLRECDKF